MGRTLKAIIFLIAVFGTSIVYAADADNLKLVVEGSDGRYTHQFVVPFVRAPVERHAPHATWVAVATLRGTSVNGRAAFTWQPLVAGSYRVRLSSPASATFTNGISALYSWTIA